MKLGKRPFVVDSRDLLFSKYLTGDPIPTPPAVFGSYGTIHNWGMLGNDEVGDCAEAMMIHWIMTLLAGSKKPIHVSRASAIKLYSDVTGYVPGQPDTDQGTVLRDLLKYMRSTGYTDADGTVHKIGAFVRVSPARRRDASWLFGGALVGLQLPQSAEDQFQNGESWTLVSGSKVIGGHAILLDAARAAAQGVDDCYVTWGREIAAEPAWSEAFID